MSALSVHLHRLFQFLESVRLQPPSTDLRIVELHPDDLDLKEGRYHVSARHLKKPAEYESRFEELIQRGYPWLNLSCYGVHNGFLIVAVEVPSETVPTASGSEKRKLHQGCATSVNLSGPQGHVVQQQWSTDSVLRFD